MSSLIKILLLTTAFVPNFASCGELTEAVAIKNGEKALEEVQRILDDVANKISAKRNYFMKEKEKDGKFGRLKRLLKIQKDGDVIKKMDEEVAKILKEVSNEALFCSIMQKREKISERLINFAANADPELKFSPKAIECTLINGTESTLDLLMMKKVDYTGIVDPASLRTFVFAAVQYNRLDMLKKLLGKKECSQTAFLDIRDRFSEKTVLFYAVKLEEGGAAMAEVLLKAGASASVKDGYDFTPLKLAALDNKLECAIVLIKYDADPTLENQYYDYVWQYARGELYHPEWRDMVALLDGYEKAIKSGKDGKTYLENLGMITG